MLVGGDISEEICRFNAISTKFPAGILQNVTSCKNERLTQRFVWKFTVLRHQKLTLKEAQAGGLISSKFTVRQQNQDSIMVAQDRHKEHWNLNCEFRNAFTHLCQRNFDKSIKSV